MPVSGIRIWINSHKLSFALMTMMAYILYFTLPSFFHGTAFSNQTSGMSIDQMAHNLGQEIGLVLSILLVILIAGWVRECQLTTGFERQWWVATVPAYGLTVAMGLFLVFLMAGGQGAADTRTITVILGTTFLVGIFEELLFRGIIQHATVQRFGPIFGVILASVLFGTMHFVNWVGGQTFSATLTQVIHATLGGFLYGVLALRVGSIWPSVILHGTWDAVVTLLGGALDKVAQTGADDLALQTGVDPAPVASGTATGAEFLLFGYEPVVGIIILAVWWWRHHSKSAALA